MLKEGDFISLNGSTGEVYKGKVETKAAELSGDFAELMQLADKYTKFAGTYQCRYAARCTGGT